MFDHELSAFAQVGGLAGVFVLAWLVVLWIFWHRHEPPLWV